MTAHRLHNVVYARLEAIASAEKITRVELGHLSRELLTYVVETHDVDIVNRLIGVLTPMNRQTSILFFTHFLPWSVEKDKQDNFNRFGKMSKGEKKLAASHTNIAAFLGDEENNIWTWAAENIEVEQKKKDFAGLIAKSITRALEGDEKTDTPPLARDELMAAIFAGGVTLDDLLFGIEARRQQEAEIMARDKGEEAAAA